MSEFPGVGASISEETKLVEFNHLERLYVSRALASYRASLVRSRNKEMVGSEVWRIRGNEIDRVADIVRKLESA